MSFLDKRQGWGESVSDLLGRAASATTAEDRYVPSSGVQSGAGRVDLGRNRAGLPTGSVRRGCGSRECEGNGLTLPWKNRRRPVIEEQWGCSKRCLRAILRSVVHGEQAQGLPFSVEQSEHRHRVPLGLVLLAQGWITHPQLQRALQEQQRERGEGRTGKRVGDWLVETCGIEKEHVIRGLGVQWSCPVLTLDGFDPVQMALVMPRVLIDSFGVLPVRVAGSRLLYMASVNQLDAASAFAVERMTGLKVESGLIDEESFTAANQSLGACASVDVSVEPVKDAEALIAKVAGLLEQKQPVASRLVRVHQFYWLRMWLEEGTRGRAGTIPRSTEDMLDFVFAVGVEG